jgi:tetrahydromethanopterin S-methyltransferase subunit F
MQLNLQAAHSHIHDVFFTTAGTRRFKLWLTDHGITVDDTGLSYSVEGNPRSIAFADIAAIHLSTGAVGEDVLDQCKIELTSGDALTVSNVTASGLPNKAQTQAYRDFVHDLHGRLPGNGAGKIRFTAGMSSLRYKGAIATMVIAGLFFVVTPLVLAIVTGDMHALFLMGAGAFFVWPFMRLVGNNTPRSYTPDALPEELIS